MAEGCAGGVRLHQRHADTHRGQREEARVAVRRTGRGRACRARSGRPRRARARPPTSFAARLRLENRTLKRALTDPRLFSGIGNAYSDEILHARGCRRCKLTSKLSDERDRRGCSRASKSELRTWTARLLDETGDRFPEKVTAFRPGMAVHGRYGQPCPRCGAPVQRIRYAANECNYCAPLPDRGPAPRRPRAVATAGKGLAANTRGTRGPEATALANYELRVTSYESRNAAESAGASSQNPRNSRDPRVGFRGFR